MNDHAVLFDLDGTLTDPKPGITRSIQHALRALGLPAPTEDELEWCIGPPLQVSFPRLLGSGDPSLVAQAIHHYRERFSTVGLFENALYDGVPEALQDLRARGFRTYVATSKALVYAVRIVEHFGLAPLFDAVYGSELDGTRSDKGELIAHLMQVEGLSAARTLMVGDREHDMVGGARNGLRCIGVTYGYGSEEELRQHGAACLADGPQALASAVGMLFAE
ncbi:MAG TPA: HAD family hydrolase [Holophaga sp.]|nr:HAD family hydrolase [Holophaga sp.]